MQFRGRQNKHHMGRGFFQCFQQRIEGALRQHMHLVDDVHFPLQCGRGITYLVPDVPDVFHPVVGGSVHFQHIGSRAVVDAFAGETVSAGIAVIRILTVDRFRQNLGAGGLPGSSGAAEQIRMGNLTHPGLIPQNRSYVILTADIVKRFWSVFPVQRLMHLFPSL